MEQYNLSKNGPPVKKSKEEIVSNIEVDDSEASDRYSHTKKNKFS
jgi:hypothetical protein